jgi:hypothetical protein
MEDYLKKNENGRQLNFKKIKLKRRPQKNGRLPQKKKGRQPQKKSSTLIGCDIIVN